MDNNKLIRESFTQKDRDMLDKATEIFSLFEKAISFTPEQLQDLVTICEEGYLYKPEKRHQEANG